MAFFTRRLHVIGLVPRRPNMKVNVKHISDDGLRWLFDRSNPSSLVRYWSDSTNGLVDISDVTVTGWRVIESDEIYDRINNGFATVEHRTIAAQAACDAARSAGIDVETFDGLVFFIGGFGVGAGKTDVTVDGRAIPAALFDVLQTHAFFAHEIGHVLGASHSFRQSFVSETYPNGEYGDPTCIMSAETFGGFSGVAPRLDVRPDSGIAGDAPLWTRAGPGPSFATVWRHFSAFPKMPHWVMELPQAPAPTIIDLYGPSSPAAGPRLIVLPTGKNSPSFYTIEYRPQAGWDRGLNFVHGVTHDTTASPGVVIHQITDIGMGTDAPGWPKLQCVDYVATIPVPSAGDQDWYCPTFGVRVLDVDPDLNSVRIQVAEQLPVVHQARLEMAFQAGRAFRSPDGPVTLQWTGPKCTPATFNADYVDRTQTVIADILATGFDTPTFSFSVNGTAIPVISDLAVSTQKGAIPIMADVRRPTGWETVSSGQEKVTVTYSIGANRLVLSIPRRIGEVLLELTGTVIENALGQGPATVSAATKTTVTTRSVELSREALEALRACHSTLVNKAKTAFPHGKIPKSALLPIPKHWGELPPEGVLFALGSIYQLSKVDVLQGRIELQRAATELRMPTPEVELLVKEIGRTLKK